MLDVVTGSPGRAGYTAFGAATIAESAVRYAQESKLISQKEATMIGNDVEAYFAGEIHPHFLFLISSSTPLMKVSGCTGFPGTYRSTVYLSRKLRSREGWPA